MVVVKTLAYEPIAILKGGCNMALISERSPPDMNGVVCHCTSQNHRHAMGCQNAPDVICPGCHEVFCSLCITIREEEKLVILCTSCRESGPPGAPKPVNLSLDPALPPPIGKRQVRVRKAKAEVVQ